MNLDQMWEKLAEYQPHAEKRGFGKAWLRMTTERTQEMAYEAWKAAEAAWNTDEYVEARVCAAKASGAAETAANLEWHLNKAVEGSIKNIALAIEQENK